MSTLLEMIAEANGILSLYTTPDATIRALYSGGKDSTVVAHLASQLPGFKGVGHVRTMTGPASIKHSAEVIDLAQKNGWSCLVAEPFMRLHMLAANGGLPGPALHTFFYSYLKERPIRQLTKDARKADKAKRVIWLTGIRKAESADRARLAHERDVQSQNEWWINPILNWSDDHIRQYIKAYGLNVANWHHSIDCFCGAYGTPPERALIMETNEDQARYINLVEQIALAGREIQLLEVKYGVRKESDVTPLEFCTWGHGLNSKSVVKQKDPKVSICNKCGVTDEVLRQKVAPVVAAPDLQSWPARHMGRVWGG